MTGVQGIAVQMGCCRQRGGFAVAGRWVCACSDREKVMEEDGVMQRRECCGHGERACGDRKSVV